MQGLTPDACCQLPVGLVIQQVRGSSGSVHCESVTRRHHSSTTSDVAWYWSWF